MLSLVSSLKCHFRIACCVIKEHLHQYEEKSGAGRRKEALKKIETEEEERSKSDNDLAIEIARQLQGLFFFHCAFIF